ncbi:hypothetical protein NQZ68_008813 [Dissostichus eleginoides]|nr:hypothetical protein NQZ68_008813 [Dissostichus eleginoides]
MCSLPARGCLKFGFIAELDISAMEAKRISPVSDDLQPVKRSSSYGWLTPSMSELRVVLLGNSWSEEFSGELHTGMDCVQHRGRTRPLYRYLRQNLDHRELLTRLGQTAKENNGESLSCDVLEFEDAGLIMTPTSEIMKAALNLGEVCGRRVSLVELPALCGKPQEEVMEESFRCVSLCDPEGVHAFILVLPVGPLTDEDKGELETIQNTFSSRVNDFTLILFTVESDPTAPAVVNFLKENKDIQELCQNCGGRHVVLNMKDQQQIPELLNAVGETRVGGSRCFTKKMFTKAQMTKVVELDNTNKRLKAELQDVKKKREQGSIKWSSSAQVE